MEFGTIRDAGEAAGRRMSVHEREIVSAGLGQPSLAFISSEPPHWLAWPPYRFHSPRFQRHHVQESRRQRLKPRIVKPNDLF